MCRHHGRHVSAAARATPRACAARAGTSLARAPPRALRAKEGHMKVMYRPAIDGFAFPNGFSLNDAELAQVKDIFHKAGAAVVAALTASPASPVIDILGTLVGIPPGTL